MHLRNTRFVKIDNYPSRAPVTTLPLIYIYKPNLASIINIPYDVAKSRIQSIEGLKGGQYHALGCHTVMKNIAASEGTRALFAGLNAKLLRLCPAGGVMMMMNEIVYDYLTTNYPLDK